MPPALHPKSGYTTSLFTTTLALSFLVVGLPHVLPCPVDPKQYAEGSMEIIDQEGRRIRVGRLPKKRLDTEIENIAKEETEQEARRGARECPVPKPSGLIGQFMGFKGQERVRPVIKVESGRIDQSSLGKEDGG